jgi:uncharacterized membrane protein
MDREIVIVTKAESTAYEMLKQLKQLDSDGLIELYADAVIRKQPNGQLVMKASNEDIRRGAGTMLGVSVGALVGLLAGPAGMVTGAAAGGMIGLSGELGFSGITGDFVHGVGQSLEPGSFAVIASVWEDWTAPIDIAAEKVGAKVLRQGSHDVAKAQIQAGMQELDDEAAFIDKEIEVASDAEKAKLRTQRAALEARQKAQRARFKTRADDLEKSWDAKIASVSEKANAAVAQSKTRHVEHMNKLRQFAAKQKAYFAEVFGTTPIPSTVS